MPADRRQIYKYKGDKCAGCGVTVQEMIDQFGDFKRLFELNHVGPAKKHPKYDNLIRQELSTEQLDEVDKCVLLCRICHGATHAQNINAEVVVRMTAGKRTAEQRFKGQLLANFKTGHATFFSDEKMLLHPYHVYVGAKKPRVLFGTELWKGQLIGLIRELPKTKSLRIKGWDGRPMVDLQADGRKGCHGKVDISFPPMSFELHKEEGHPVFIWVRNGIALTREGEVIHGGTVTYYGEIVK